MMDEMGWEDDDDFLDDDDESTETDVESTGAVALGPGLLMGRLSRFIEAVTQPEEELSNPNALDETGESLGLQEQGWGDDGLDNLDDGGWEQDDVALDDVLVVEEDPNERQQNVVGESSGWDDDLQDLDDESLHEESQLVIAEEPQQNVGWGDDALQDFHDESLHEESQLLVEEPQQNAGWEDDALEGLDDDESLHEESQPVAEQPKQNVGGLDDSVPESTPVAQGGWGDDSLEGLDESIPAFPVSSLPESTPADEGGWGDESLEGSFDNDEIPPANGGEGGSGWDDDGLDGLDEGDYTPAAGVVVDHVPTPRIPKRSESMMTAADESTVQRENARDDEDEVAEGDFGPVVNRMPSFENSEHADRTVSTLVPSSVGEELDEESRLKSASVTGVDPNAVLDHVPVDIPDVTQNASDSTASVDGDGSSILRDNARDNGTFGPVLNRMPSSYHLEHTDRTVSTVASSSIREELSEAKSAQITGSDQDGVVDHVPLDISDVMQSDALSAKAESTVSVEGDGSSILQENIKDDDDFGPVLDHIPSNQNSAYSTNTVSAIVPSSVCEELDEDSKLESAPFAGSDPDDVVDHVPEDIPDVTQNYSGTSANIESTGSVEGDGSSTLRENVRDFGPVFDRIPSNHDWAHSAHTVSTVVPSSVNEELDKNDEGETDETRSVDAALPAPSSFGVVDHVPEGDALKSTNQDSVLAVASEMSVASELSNTIGDEALESDIDPNEENYMPVVDHTPPPVPSLLSRRSTSVRVQAPIEELDDEDDDDEKQYFGPVVDHTPTVQPSAVSSVTGSMAAHAPPSEVADDSDDDLDERTGTIEEQEGEGSGYDFHDDDTLDAPAPSLVSASRDGPPVVDHVPRRPGARPTDASTLVLIDPSEVSTVGDSTYGLVVDHLPPSRPSMQASATVSTVLATTSVGQDDTLVDDLDDVADRHHSGNESEGEDDATLPTLDNQPSMEANIVDHVPEAGPVYRIDSELTNAPTPSVLSPDETRDSGFGLVLDHLPAIQPSVPPSVAGSMAVLAPASVVDEDMESATIEEEVNVTGEQPASERTTEEAKAVVDHLPPVRVASVRSTNSTVTIRSQASEDETLEGVVRPDRFLPVVDHTPTFALPLALSLGGSTTGALATLSEVNDATIVDEDVTGWDYDEHELDSIQESERFLGENGRQSRAGRGLSVTFSPQTVNTVGGHDEAAGNNGFVASIAAPDESRYYDAELGGPPDTMLNESQYFDPESGQMVEDGKPAASQDESFEDAPLTNGAVTDVKSSVRCSSCAEAKTAECPCIRSILDANTDDDAMVVSVMTPEGIPVKIDFRKLLQHETTKRLLLEKELEACHATIEALEIVGSQREARSSQDESAAEKLRESAKIHAKERDSLREDCDALRNVNEELSAQLATSRNEMSALARERDEWVHRESALQAEMEELRQTCETSISEAHQLAFQNEKLASEIGEMQSAKDNLSNQLTGLKIQRDLLEVKNNELLNECAMKEKLLSDMTRERSEWSSRKSALDAEMIQLRRALEESSSAATSETHRHDQLRSLQIEAATKSGECEELRSQVDQIQKKLQASEGRNFVQMKESMRSKRHHDGEIAKYLDQIKSLEKNQEKSATLQEMLANDLNARLAGMGSELQLLKSENESLKKAIDDTRSEHQGQMRQQKVSFQEKQGRVHALEIKVKLLEMEKVKLSKNVSLLNSQLQDSATKANVSAALKEEYDSLQETLFVNKGTIQSLQEQVEALSQANSQGTEQMETIVKSLTEQRDTLRNTLQSNDDRRNALMSELDASLSEKKTLQDRMESLTAKCRKLEATVEGLQSTAVKHELELAEKERRCKSLQDQVTTNRTSPKKIREEYEREVSELKQLVKEREETLLQLQSRERAQEKALEERDVAISKLEEQSAGAQQHAEITRRERDDIVARYQELEAELARTNEQQNILSESIKQHEAKERELQEIIDVLDSERDEALKEREFLEEDNEELLVQLGLIKEQLDAQDGEVEKLKRTIADKEIAAQHAEERLREAEAYAGELSRRSDELHDHPQENGAHQSGKLDALEQTVDELTLEKEDLQQQVDDLSSTNAYIDAQVTSLRDEKVEWLDRLRELEQREQDFGADAAMTEDQRMSRIRDLEERCRRLEELCKSKDVELGRANVRLHEALAATSNQAEIDSLQRHIVHLEHSCSERDRALHANDMALEALRMEVEELRAHAEASNAPVQSNDAFDAKFFNRKLQHAEDSARHYQARLAELESILEQLRQELEAVTEKLSETEAALFDKELEFDVDEQNKITQKELQKQLQQMESLLEQRNQEIRNMTERQRTMEQRMDVLLSSQSLANGPASSARPDEAGMHQLRAQLTALQQQLHSSTAQYHEKEESIRHEVLALEDAIARKKEQIDSLEHQLQSLSVEFSSSQEQLMSKEADYRRLSLELEETRAQNLQSTRNVTSQVLDASSREEAESISNMRSHIVSLARALEHSEMERADAIERLLKEREANSVNLRRLAESVKRFYSTLSCGDA
jgi:chromosome segregation ATPase